MSWDMRVIPALSTIYVRIAISWQVYPWKQDVAPAEPVGLNPRDFNFPLIYCSLRQYTCHGTRWDICAICERSETARRCEYLGWAPKHANWLRHRSVCTWCVSWISLSSPRYVLKVYSCRCRASGILSTVIYLITTHFDDELYDYLLQIGVEFEFIWMSRKWSYTKAMFLLVRYLPIVNVYFVLHSMSSFCMILALWFLCATSPQINFLSTFRPRAARGLFHFGWVGLRCYFFARRILTAHSFYRRRVSFGRTRVKLLLNGNILLTTKQLSLWLGLAPCGVSIEELWLPLACCGWLFW